MQLCLECGGVAHDGPCPAVDAYQALGQALVLGLVDVTMPDWATSAYAMAQTAMTLARWARQRPLYAAITDQIEFFRDEWRMALHARQCFQEGKNVEYRRIATSRDTLYFAVQSIHPVWNEAIYERARAAYARLLQAQPPD